jgi:hypothetical protein
LGIKTLYFQLRDLGLNEIESLTFCGFIDFANQNRYSSPETHPRFNSSKMASNNEELFKHGLKNRQEVVGEDYVSQALQNGSSEFSFSGQQFVTE